MAIVSGGSQSGSQYEPPGQLLSLLEIASQLPAGQRITRLLKSFFHLLKTERIRRKTYKTRDDARQDVFDYIELFYNPKQKHGKNGMLSPVDFERLQKVKLQGVQQIRGTSPSTSVKYGKAAIRIQNFYLIPTKFRSRFQSRPGTIFNEIVPKRQVAPVLFVFETIDSNLDALTI